MNNQNLKDNFNDLSTPLTADARIRLGIPLRLAPAGIRRVIACGPPQPI
jgi:hypothetical protein